MRLFIRVVDRASFTAAAGDLGLSRATATEALKTLEAALGAKTANLLTDEGCMTVNLFGRTNSYARSLAHIQQAFGEDAGGHAACTG